MLMGKIAKGTELDLFVEKLAFGGKGVARLDGFVVFFDRAVPGQTVRARIVKKKRNYAEARVIDVISQSPHYTPPACAHFGTCGGCTWQDIAYDVQIYWKRRHVIECLDHIAGVGEAGVEPIVASPQQYYYRNKMEFTFSDRRWLLPEEMERGGQTPEDLFALGLHVRGFFDKVFNIEDCRLQSPLCVAIVKEVRDWAKKSALPAYSIRTHDGFWRFLVIREGKKTGQTLVHLITSTDPRAEDVAGALSGHLVSMFPEITTFIHSLSDKKSQVAAGDSSRVLFGTGCIEEKLANLRFRISAHSFFQTNSLGAEKLYDKVLELGGFDGSENVWDLYCGTGTIAIYLASRVKQVVGIELVEEAVRDAAENCRINDIRNCSFLSGDLKDVIKKARRGVARCGGHRPAARGDAPQSDKSPVGGGAPAHCRGIVQPGKPGARFVLFP